MVEEGRPLNINTSFEQTHTDESRTATIFGYELLREVLLPEILGKDTPEILYWAGKRIARIYPVNTLEEIIEFFNRAAWGDLTLKSENKNEMEFELTSP